MRRLINKVKCFFGRHYILNGKFYDTKGHYYYDQMCGRCGVMIGWPQISKGYLTKLYPPVLNQKR